jgi:hypothetical protein
MIFIVKVVIVTIIPITIIPITKTITGWWFQPTPLKNDGVRQLG